MTYKISVLFLLSCTLCAAQSVPCAPGHPCQSSTTSEDHSSLNADLTASDEGSPDQTPQVNSKVVKRLSPVKPRDPAGDDPEKDTKVEEAPPAAPLQAGAPPKPSDFELFAEDAAGQPIEVYGRRLFDAVPTTFAPLDRVPVPSDYVLGPGDELQIRVWGSIDLESHPIIDRNGQISLLKVGSLRVAGLRFQQLEGFLRSAVGNLYKNFELTVSLGQLRSIQVFVLGSARQPGTYTLSSLSTLVNALFASGGPSTSGSMRRIQLRRDNCLLTEFDIYDLLRRGDKSHDVQLLPGDVIYIPPVGPQVAIVANVNEPGIYELKGDTTVGSAVEEAGGLTNLAGADRVLLERVENRRRRHVDEFPLDSSGLQKMLKDGDLVRIFGISPQFDNAVTIRGNVANPGRFTWHEGMRISDLVPSRDVLVTREHWHQQNHLADKSHPEMMTEIVATSSEINWDYAAIERLDERDLSTRLIPFNLGNAIDRPASPDNQILKVGDVVTIFSRKDIAMPLEKHSTFIHIGGEINAPGVYRVAAGATLRDAVEQAGGLTAHSYLYASQLTRVSTRKIQEEQLKVSIDQMQKDLISSRASESGTSAEALAAPQAGSQKAANQQAQLSAEEALISRLAEVRPTGRVVLGVNPDARSITDIPEFLLEDGDSFYIPPALGTVQVTGEVYNANAFRYQAGRQLALYLKDSGGPSRTADVKRIFLIRADGTVLSRQSRDRYWSGDFGRQVLMPGDTVVVPPKLKSSGGIMDKLSVVTQILSQTAMTGAVLSLIH